ncbi:MAG: hypothetical protein F4Y03_10245 [Alphaproteobacteria bacterium]|nr:hypothetical protein [Alphaproteobacteria bacterium]
MSDKPHRFMACLLPADGSPCRDEDVHLFHTREAAENFRDAVSASLGRRYAFFERHDLPEDAT